MVSMSTTGPLVGKSPPAGFQAGHCDLGRAEKLKEIAHRVKPDGQF